MYYMGVTSNIMSLSGIAIAIGAMVDASIIMVENAHKKLEAVGIERDRFIRDTNVFGQFREQSMSSKSDRCSSASLRGPSLGRGREKTPACGPRCSRARPHRADWSDHRMSVRGEPRAMLIGVVTLEQHHFVLLHVRKVEPSMRGVVRKRIHFADPIAINQVVDDEVLLRDGLCVAHRERRCPAPGPESDAIR